MLEDVLDGSKTIDDFVTNSVINFKTALLTFTQTADEQMLLL